MEIARCSREDLIETREPSVQAVLVLEHNLVVTPLAVVALLFGPTAPVA